VEQGIKVLTNPRATSEQKSAAITQVGTTIVTDAARKTVRRKREAIISAVKKHGGTVAGIVIPAAIGIAAAKQIPKQRAKEATAFADRELARTKAALAKKGTRLTDEQSANLWRQYFDWAMKQPVTNSFLGK